MHIDMPLSAAIFRNSSDCIPLTLPRLNGAPLPLIQPIVIGCIDEGHLSPAKLDFPVISHCR